MRHHLPLFTSGPVTPDDLLTVSRLMALRDGPAPDQVEDEPVTIIFISALNEDEDDNGSGPADQPLSDEDDLDDDLDDDEDFEFELTPEGIAEIEREQDRQDVAHLGKIVDNMVYIVGMYSALVQNKVGA